MIALFVFASNWGCVVLQAIFIGVTVFVQVHLSSAFHPLQYMLPLSLTHQTDKSEIGANGTNDNPASLEKEPGYATGQLSGTSASADAVESGRQLPSGGAIARYFTPWKFLTPEALHQTLLSAPCFHEPAPQIPESVESTAYQHPAIQSTNPVVWVPKDPWGLSTHQVEFLTSRDVNATEEGAWFEVDDVKKKATYNWSNELEQIPIYTAPTTF
jgi:hypothetical protein